MFRPYFLMSLTRLPSTVLFFSHEDGTRLGVEHLIALGHQQIALLAGPLSSVSARLRLRTGIKYLTRNQIHPIAEREGDLECHVRFSTNYANAE